MLGGGLLLIGLLVVGGSLLSGGLSSNSPNDNEFFDDQFSEFEGVVTVNKLVDPWLPEASGELPSPGRRFVALDVTVENPGDGDVPVYAGSYGFKLTDSGNFAYSATVSQAKPVLQEELELAPGERTRGWIMFEVDEGNTIESLIYWSAEVALPP